MSITRPEHPGARNPYSAINYHKDWIKDNIKHTILPVNHFTKPEREAVRSVLKPILTGEQAQAMVYREDPISKKKGHQFGWSYKIDNSGRVGVLAFRGTEVAVFYKRQTTEVIPEPGELMPEGILQEPTDVWMRFDLMGRSSREQNLFLAQRHSRLEEEVAIQKQEIQAKESFVNAVETENYKLKNRIEWLEKRIARLTEEKDAKGKSKKEKAGKVTGTKKVTRTRNHRPVQSSHGSSGRARKSRANSHRPKK